MNTLIAITGLGVLCLLLEILNVRKAIVPIALAGLAATLGLTWSEFGMTEAYYNDMIITDKFGMSFSMLFIVLTMFLIAMAADFYKEHSSRISDYISLKIFLLAGAVAMVTFGNMAMFFLGIEILSITLYVLAASDRLNVRSNEAGMKYFLMGSFASGIILFGIALIYGATGSFNVAEIFELSKSELIPQWFYLGMIMLVVGMLFKVAAVPFHFWAPDVYEGSPALSTATMSTLAKVTAMATLYKLIAGLNAEPWLALDWVLGTVCVASMLVGNFMALRQDNVKRMLAFSGISHAGIMLMALFTPGYSASSLLYYAAAYSFSGIAAFAVVLYVCRDQKDEHIINFDGLAKNNPLMAAILSGAMLSMAGIPIFAGFFAKFMLFNQAIEAGYLAIVLVAVVTSIVSVGYYFKLILAMYTRQPSQASRPVPFVLSAVAIVSMLAIVALGIYPEWLTGLLG
jgi:NADH-quinone oxidoreductase subunit N